MFINLCQEHVSYIIMSISRTFYSFERDIVLHCILSLSKVKILKNKFIIQQILNIILVFYVHLENFYSFEKDLANFES